MTPLKRLLRVFLSLAFIGAGVFAMKALIHGKPTAPRALPRERGALVEVMAVTRGAHPVEVNAAGVVVPSRALTLQAQVGGKITAHHEGLVVGGRIPSGAVALRIEAADYELQVAERRAQVERAEQELELEEGRRAVAEREWALMGRRAGADDRSKGRALRDPQRKQALANLASARSALDLARLNVDRTRVRVPFDALVLDENVEIGQVISPGATLARLVGVEAYWIEVAIPTGDLFWLDVPGLAMGAPAPEVGCLARVTHRAGDREIVREGRVVRLAGELDPVGRMARLVVEVRDPLGVQSGEPPLLLGAYVDVALVGRSVTNVAALPRTALREGDRVWVAEAAVEPAKASDGVGEDEQDRRPRPELTGGDSSSDASSASARPKDPRRRARLAVRPVQVVRRLQDTVLVGEGLAPGDEVIVSRLGAAIPGTLLRIDEPGREAPTGDRQDPTVGHP